MTHCSWRNPWEAPGGRESPCLCPFVCTYPTALSFMTCPTSHSTVNSLWQFEKSLPWQSLHGPPSHLPAQKLALSTRVFREWMWAPNNGFWKEPVKGRNQQNSNSSHQIPFSSWRHPLSAMLNPSLLLPTLPARPQHPSRDFSTGSCFLYWSTHPPLSAPSSVCPPNHRIIFLNSKCDHYT